MYCLRMCGRLGEKLVGEGRWKRGDNLVRSEPVRDEVRGKESILWAWYSLDLN